MVRKTGRLTLLFSLLFSSPLPGMEDYYVSYALLTEKQSVTAERIYISRAMTPLGEAGKELCRFETDLPDFQTFIKYRKHQIVTCLMRQGVLVRSYETSRNAVISREAVWITLPPVGIKVAFNDGVVIVRKVKSEK